MKQLTTALASSFLIAVLVAPGVNAHVDASTNQFHQTAEPEWIHPDWSDPGAKLADVSFSGVPITEVANQLRQLFTNAFDVIVPGVSQTEPTLTADPAGINVNVQLKNVTATELFNAMNLAFEAEHTAVRWELTMNGSRPTALLRALPSLTPPLTPPIEKKPTVYFVGDLVGEGDHGTMNMSQLYETVSKVYDMAFGTDKTNASQYPSQTEIKFHVPSQLLIVSATPDRVDFVLQTLKALRDKARLDNAQSAAARATEK